MLIGVRSKENCIKRRSLYFNKEASLNILSINTCHKVGLLAHFVCSEKSWSKYVHTLQKSIQHTLRKINARSALELAPLVGQATVLHLIQASVEYGWYFIFLQYCRYIYIILLNIVSVFVVSWHVNVILYHKMYVADIKFVSC